MQIGLQNAEGAHQAFVNRHDRAGVVEFAAIVGRREDGDELPVGEELVAVLHDLVRAHHQVEVVLLQELADNVGAEGVRHAAVVLCPARDVRVRVGPHQIAKQACVRHVRRPHDVLNLLHALQVWREAGVHAEDLLVDHRRDGQHVEHLLELLPKLDVVSPLALVVEAVDAVDRGALVVAAQQEEVLRVFDLVGQQQADALQPVLAAVHKVPQEEVVRVGGKATVLKHAKQVVVLPVDIPADLDRRLELEQSRLVNENLFALDNDELHLVVGELHRGARLLIPHCQQLFDDHIALLIGHVRLRAPPPAPGP
mmetsp:Transcript_20130/g.47559  ORF Transcript_20130/g.47559 Transcript_20130/m.47559 type:complete len:311 (+) Transcript_20130:506-1438(+)